ncbi:MFS transporter [Acinetobacter baumannii]|nr:MFS transporter [Acinetobacter baumannii]
MAALTLGKQSNLDVTRKIISVVIFTAFAYLSVGLPLAVLPKFIVKDLNFAPFLVGLIISLQYLATLLTRHSAGQLVDRKGSRYVVLLGLSCCGLSGVFAFLALSLVSYPLVSISLLAISRLFLGSSESYCSTGATLWGMQLAGPTETSRVISWNGAATYLSMAIGAPLGVFCNAQFGQFGFAILTIILAIVGFFLAYRKTAIRTGNVRPVSLPILSVLSKVWIFGLGQAVGTLGFGVLSTFVALFFLEKGWSNAALALSLFSIGFVGVRFIFSNTIQVFGGKNVALCAFLVEAIGLLTIWQSGDRIIAYAGAFLVGTGFSMVFPAMGVEAMKKFNDQNKGVALGVFTAFFDIALLLIGPIASLLIPITSVQNLYGVMGCITLLSIILLYFLFLKDTKQQII